MARPPLLWITALVGACSSATPAELPPAGPPAPSSHASAIASPLSNTAKPGPSSASSAEPADAPPPTARLAPVALPSLELPVKQLLTEPVFSLAIDPEKDKVAALGAEPHLREADRWRRLALPAAFKGPEGSRQTLRIHFGRDNQPRILGTRWLADGQVQQVYLRFRHGRWKEEPRELAAFAAPPAAPLYGVLGIPDPEILCKSGKFCLIKQRSGWSEVPLPIAPPALPVRIDLGADGGFALLDDRLLRLGKKAWQPLGDATGWKGASAAWLRDDHAWVTVAAAGADKLHHYDGQRWSSEAAPIAGPRGLWGDGAGRLWLVGDGGAAMHDGQRWQRLAGVPGPVSEVVGHRATVYLGGRSGLWSLTATSGQPG